MNSQNHLDTLDNLDRFTAQAKAALLCLSTNDNFKQLSEEVVADALWLISDRLDDIHRQLKGLK